MAQTFPKGSDDYNKVMQTALIVYPESKEAAINLANVALRQDDLLKAETLLDRAGDSGEAENARAILYMKQDRYADAEAALSRAKAKGMNVSLNQEILRSIKKK